MKRPRPVPKPPATPAPRSTPSRLVPLLGLVVVLIGLGLWTWREPLELSRLRGAPVEAIAAYAQQHPDSPAAATVLGEAYLREKRAAEAVTYLGPVTDRFPAQAGLRVLLARALYEAGKTTDAYGHLQVVLNTLDHENADARWWLGQVQERSGRADEAYDTYEALVRQQPRHVPALLRLGTLALGDGRFSVAEDFYRRAAEAAPKDAEAAGRHAEVLFRLGRADQAAAEARRALRLAPDGSRGNFWLGRSLLVLDAHAHGAEAEAALRNAAAHTDQPYEARYFLAKLLRQLGRTEEALKELERNTRENPLHQNSFYDLALAARALGQTQRAEQAMSRARWLASLDDTGRHLEYQVWAAPDDQEAHLRLARFYLKSQRPDLARPQVEQVLRRNANQAEARRLAQQIESLPSPHSP